MQAMLICGDHDLNMERLRDDIIFHEPELKMENLNGSFNGYGSGHRQLRPVPEEPRAQRLEALVRQLFNLQDLNNDGVIEEADLASLGDRIGRIRQGKGFNSAAIRTTGRALLHRERLDAFGRPVPYPIFRKCVLRILQELDSDEQAQELILEQFVSEANVARGRGVGAFRYKCNNNFSNRGVAQAPYLPVAPRRISIMPVAPCINRMGISLSRDPRMQTQQMVTL